MPEDGRPPAGRENLLFPLPWIVSNFVGFWRRFTWPQYLWAAFLCYGPVGLFLVLRFRWQFSFVNAELCAYIGLPAVVSGICALVAAVVYLFIDTAVTMLYLLIFAASFCLLFTPVLDILWARSFADFIKPETAYVQKHCTPIDFEQDSKRYKFGICDLVISKDGSDDFSSDGISIVYDTSGDIQNFTNLSAKDRRIFVDVVRKYYNDDPNTGFEYADFTAKRFFDDFYDVTFDESETEGFTPVYGRPPKNPKSPYPPFF